MSKIKELTPLMKKHLSVSQLNTINVDEDDKTATPLEEGTSKNQLGTINGACHLGLGCCAILLSLYGLNI